MNRYSILWILIIIITLDLNLSMAMLIFVVFQGTAPAQYALEIPDTDATVNDIRAACEETFHGMKTNGCEALHVEGNLEGEGKGTKQGGGTQGDFISDADLYSLTFEGKELSNPEKLLSDVGISAESRIYAEKCEKWRTQLSPLIERYGEAFIKKVVDRLIVHESENVWDLLDVPNSSSLIIAKSSSGNWEWSYDPLWIIKFTYRDIADLERS